MKHSKIIGLSAAVLFAALWGLPVARAASFFRRAQDYCRETGSINASNDLRFSSGLLGCYLVSLLTAFAFAWLATRRPRFSLLWPGSLLAYAAGEVLWLRPETPIHLFPTMTPWRPVYISAVAAVITAALVFFPRTDRHGRNAQPLARANGHAATLHDRLVSLASLFVSLAGLSFLYGRRSAPKR